jgi:hypothetical protein
MRNLYFGGILVGIFLGILVVGAILIPPTTSPQTSNQSTSIISSQSSPFTINSQSTSISPTQTALTSTRTSLTASQRLGPLLLEGVSSIGYVDSSGGHFSNPYSTAGGLVHLGSPITIYFPQPPYLVYGQNLTIRLTYDPLGRVIYQTLGTVTLAGTYAETVSVLNTGAIPSIIPLSWGVKVGDNVTLDIYSTS